ncbi:GTA-gp10 family protein, partial [Staphylococcus aureus]|nr:GTA-gp10 family protein [Staphylococcus aureus]
MSAPANPMRGEAALRVGGSELVVRPSFQALVAAEGELGPLFELVERAGEGKLSLGEAAALIWHCL